MDIYCWYSHRHHHHNLSWKAGPVVETSIEQVDAQVPPLDAVKTMMSVSLRRRMDSRHCCWDPTSDQWYRNELQALVVALYFERQQLKKNKKNEK